MRLMKGRIRLVTIGLILTLTVALLATAGCGNTQKVVVNPTLTFADAGWDSIQFHNEVASFIIEKGYDKTQWEKDYTTAFPAVRVTIAANKELATKAPDVNKFLTNYKTSSVVTSDALAYMQEKNVGTEEAAKWFLTNNKDMWKKWIPEDIARKVEEALK